MVGSLHFERAREGKLQETKETSKDCENGKIGSSNLDDAVQIS